MVSSSRKKGAVGHSGLKTIVHTGQIVNIERYFVRTSERDYAASYFLMVKGILINVLQCVIYHLCPVHVTCTRLMRVTLYSCHAAALHPSCDRNTSML